MTSHDPKAVTRRTKVAPTKRMSRFLKHFTVVGDDYHTWNVNYKKWENEEEEEEPAPTSAEGEGNAEGPDAEAGSASTPRQSLDFRSRLRKLFSSHRFQVIIINGIIISVKTRSERQILRLKQINIQLATKIQHLEFSCSEKVRLEWFHCCPLQSMLTPRL